MTPAAGPAILPIEKCPSSYNPDFNLKGTIP
jgi:hypothetical protein